MSDNTGVWSDEGQANRIWFKIIQGMSETCCVTHLARLQTTPKRFSKYVAGNYFTCISTPQSKQRIAQRCLVEMS